MNVNVSVDVSGAVDSLKEFGSSFPNIQKKALRVIGQGAVKEIKKAIRLTTKKRTGGLRKAYKYKVSKDGDYVTVYPSKKVSPHLKKIVPIVSALNYGADTSRRTDRRAGIQRKSIAGRGFIEKGESFLQGRGYMPGINKMVQQEIKKFFES